MHFPLLFNFSRKLRREKRKNPGKLGGKKDPGVPKECPFKEQVLIEVEEAKQRKIKEREERRKKFKTARGETKEGGESGSDSQKENQVVTNKLVWTLKH